MQFAVPTLLLALSTFTLAAPTHQNSPRDATPEPLADPVPGGMSPVFFQYMNNFRDAVEEHPRPKDNTSPSEWRERAMRKEQERLAKKKAKEEKEAKEEKSGSERDE